MAFIAYGFRQNSKSSNPFDFLEESIFYCRVAVSNWFWCKLVACEV